MTRRDFTHQELLSILRYEDGNLFWTARRPGVKVGKTIGHLGVNGYMQLMIYKKHYLLHRLIWFYHHGRWPTGCLDHINRDKLDNRIGNLREASLTQNQWNSARSNNSGVKGVYYDSATNRYSASISWAGKTKRLGRFKTLEEAAAVRRKAASQIHGEFYCEATA